MTKIIPRIFGGIGNQLFCYAAARRLALVNNAEIVIDDVSGFVRDFEYRRHYQLDHFSIPCPKASAAERLEPFSRVRRYLKRAYNLCRSFETRSYIKQESMDFEPRLLQVRPRGTLYLEGYWQSEDYFKDVEEIIRADLRIKSPTDATNLHLEARIRDSLSIAVHVRFFDAPNASGVNNVSGDYYARAVKRMEMLVPDAHYFLFSDHPEVARALIPLPDQRITLVSHNKGDENAYADLWLMTHCKHFIIANSTFSWWGAWIAGNIDKIVLTPKLHIQSKTTWSFDGLIPRAWVEI